MGKGILGREEGKDKWVGHRVAPNTTSSRLPRPVSTFNGVNLQRAPIGLTQGFAINFYASSTGRLALLHLLPSQERKKMVKELLKKN